MTVNFYSIFDRVAGTFSEPFVAINDEVAKRKFNYLMEHSKMISADCSLYSLKACFDTQSGFISCDVVDKLALLCNYEGGF